MILLHNMFCFAETTLDMLFCSNYLGLFRLNPVVEALAFLLIHLWVNFVSFELVI
jgi:hypothetical protein